MKRLLLLINLLVAASMLLAACGETEVTRVVTEKETVIETVVEKETVIETVIEKETVVETVIEKETVVETVIEKETVLQTVVEKETVTETVVEKETVVQTVVEEKEVVVTATPEPKAAEEKVLVIASSQEPDNLFHLMGNMMVVGDIKSLMTRYVIGFADDNLPRCELCVELPSVENGLWSIDEGAGTMELKYEMKQGLMWADGEEITAHDVAFANELLRDEQYEYGPSYIEPIDRVEAIDDYNFVVYYSAIFPFADTETFRLNVIPEHYYRPIWDEYKAEGGDYWNRFKADERVAVKPLVNGPFMVEEWVGGSHINLVRNPNFNIGPLAKIERIQWRFIRDTNVLNVNVATRQVHLTDGWLSLEQAGGLEAAQGVDVRYVPVIWLEHGTVQINEPPLDDLRVRQALMYGMDREAINEALFNGQQPPANSWLPPSHPAHNPDVKKYPYDPEMAAELLDEAGWTLDSDGVRRNSAGDALTITYINIAGDRPREQVAAAIQANWQELGIQANIEPQTSRLLFSETLPQNKMVAGGVAVWRWVIDGAQEAQYAKSFWYPSDDVGGNYDLLRWDSDWGQIERNVELIDEALQTLDREKRYELVREQQAIWAENLPVLPVYWFKRVATVDERLQGVSLATAPQVGWNAEEWEFVEP